MDANLLVVVFLPNAAEEVADLVEVFEQAPESEQILAFWLLELEVCSLWLGTDGLRDGKVFH